MRQYFSSFLLSLILHLGIIGIFIFNVASTPNTLEKPQEMPDIIEASILDETLVQAKAHELKQQQTKRKNQQKQQKEAIKKQLLKEKKTLQRAKQKRLKEEALARKQADRHKKQALAEQKKLALIQQEIAQEKQQQQAQKKKRLAEEKQRQADQKLDEENKRVAEAKRKKILAEQETQKKQAEEKKKIAEKKRQDAEKHQQQAAAKKQQALKEQQRIAAAKIAEENRINAKIAQQASTHAITAIKHKVTQNWNQIGSMQNGLACELNVRLVPSGDVISVRVTKSSGHSLFDDSAERAVRKASPLPVPKDPSVFKNFRNFKFTFSPN